MIKLALIIAIGCASAALADGPIFRSSNTFIQQEFDNVYSTIRNPGIDSGSAKILNITTETVKFLTISTTTISSATITAATLNSVSITGSIASVSISTLTSVSSATITNATIKNLLGVTDGTSPCTGCIGETLSAVLVSASAKSGTNNQYVDVSSLTLTAGTWDVTIIANLILNGATVSDMTVGIGSAAGNSATGLTADNNMELAPWTATNFPVTVAAYRISTNATGGRYFKFFASFTGGPPKCYGRISAVRVY